MYLSLLFIAICATLFHFLHNKPQKDAAKKIPGPFCIPLIGNAHMVYGNGAVFFSKLIKYSKVYGRRFKILAGSYLYVFFNTSEDVEIILNKSGILTKSEEYRRFEPWLGMGVLTSDGDKWKERRKLITPAFHFTVLERFIPVFDRTADTLIDKLSKCVHMDSVNVYPLVTLCTLDMISETAMGVPVKAQERGLSAEYITAINDICRILLLRIKDAIYRLDIFFFFSSYYKVHDSAIEKIHAYTDKVIKDRKQLLAEEEIHKGNDEGQNDIGIKRRVAFLDLLLESTSDGKKMDDLSLREEVDTLLFAGHDTTASGIMFSLYCIAANADVQKKLYEEQLDIFGDLKRPVTYTDLQNMKYLEMTLKEVLRLFPPIPVIARRADKDYQINDILMPLGTTMVINLAMVHRDPVVFPDPEKFIPERFTPEACAKRNPYAYAPFSIGPRNCLGHKYAMFEMKTVLSKIIRSFNIKPVDIPLILAADFILNSYSGVNIKFEHRP